jgi:hypothetical protein
MEAKYHVYVQGKYVGPLSREVLVDELMQEHLGQDAFVWTEGRKDWCRIGELVEFSKLAQHLPLNTTVDLLPRPVKRQDDFAYEYEKIRFLNAGAGSDFLGDTVDSDRIQKPSTLPSSPKTLDREFIKTIATQVNSELSLLVKQAFRRNRNRAIKSIAALAGVALLILSVQQIFFPADPTIFSSLNTTSARTDQLRKIIFSRGSSSTSPLASWALLKSDGQAPQILLAANFPNNTRLRVKIQGISSTLVGALRGETTIEAVINQKMAVIPALRQGSGEFLPEGFYEIEFSCLTCGDTAAPVKLVEPLFIGPGDGLAGAEAAYAKRRADFSNVLRQQAQSEVAELLQMSEALLGIARTTVKLPIGSAKPTGKRKDNEKIIDQIGQILLAVDAATVEYQYVLPKSYLRLKATYLRMIQEASSLKLVSADLRGFQDKIRLYEQRLQATPKLINEDLWN